MKFKTRELSLKNVIGFHLAVDFKKDVFKQVVDGATAFKKEMLQNGYYTDGPAYFTYLPGQETISVFTTIGNKVNLVGETPSNVFFQEQLAFTTAYYYRHYDQEEPIPYEAIQEEIEKAGLDLKNIYHVVLNLYGDSIIDLYCEVE
ncbi:hypothetical protein [Streptococcus oricebi]|uniref:DUF1398 domain-containing protein n=1 Tax=Streptococcus oricebi TaxID=1547447 RepID=A0ABS5B5E2_9STRE|nr:hypothetical protein [Streptococcus oricebi]MBP2624054.1 hypothetical protein [Streptococcus oricebi]